MVLNESFDNGVLTLFPAGKIDSGNAPQYEKAILKAASRKGVKSVIFDLKDLDYITSAGLRIILGVWKKYPGSSVVNANSAVYEIFVMTGFSQMMPVSHAMREISIEGLPVIGEGFTATVYRLSGDSIVKVFRAGRSLESVNAEIDAAKKAFIYGIPTAISFDTVRVGDRYGLVFEMLDCATLRDLIVAHPSEFPKYKAMYADLSYKITHTHAPDANLGDCKSPLLEKFSVLSTVLTPEEYGKLIGMIEAIPDADTLTHGDFHIKNVLVQNGEPILIDMDSVSLGAPIFELEDIYLSYKAYNEAEPNNASDFFGVEQAKLDALFDAVVHRYFPGKSAAELQAIYDKVILLGTTHLAYQTIHYKKDINGRLDKALARIRDLLSRYDDLILE